MVTVAWGKERKRLPWEWGMLPLPLIARVLQPPLLHRRALLHGGSLTSASVVCTWVTQRKALRFSWWAGFWKTANGVPISMHSTAVLWRTVESILCSPELVWIWRRTAISYLLWQIQNLSRVLQKKLIVADQKIRRILWNPHVKTKHEKLNLKLQEMSWLLGRKSTLSTENKLLLYKCIIKPTWTYGIQPWGCTKLSNTKII
jgi:hypothetical protein